MQDSPTGRRPDSPTPERRQSASTQSELPRSELRIIARLLADQRWAALASTGADGGPLASMVAFVACESFDALLLHLSRLSRHTQNLTERPAASLVISEPDDGLCDPQTLGRISLIGAAVEIPRNGADYDACRGAYLARLPRAERLFGFSDFVMFRFVLQSAHYVGGFARAYALELRHLRAAARSIEP